MTVALGVSSVVVSGLACGRCMRAPLGPISPSTDTRVASVVLRVNVLRSTHTYETRAPVRGNAAGRHHDAGRAWRAGRATLAGWGTLRGHTQAAAGSGPNSCRTRSSSQLNSHEDLRRFSLAVEEYSQRWQQAGVVAAAGRRGDCGGPLAGSSRLLNFA